MSLTNLTDLTDREKVRRLSNFINEAAGPETALLPISTLSMLTYLTDDERTALLWAHDRATYDYPALPGGWWFDNLLSASRKLRR